MCFTEGTDGVPVDEIPVNRIYISYFRKNFVLTSPAHQAKIYGWPPNTNRAGKVEIIL